MSGQPVVMYPEDTEMLVSEEPGCDVNAALRQEDTPKQEESMHIRHDISEDAYERASDLLTGDSLFPPIFYDGAKSGLREHESDLCGRLKGLGFNTQEIYGIMVNFYPGEKWRGRNRNLGYRWQIIRKGIGHLHTINIYDMPRLNDQVEEALESLGTNNDPPLIFKRAGHLCRIDEIEDGDYAIKPLDRAAIRMALAESANWTKWVETQDGDPIEKDIYPPPSVVDVVYSRGDWQVPRLKGITNTPIIRSDGSIFDILGFDGRTGFFYLPDEDFRLPAIAEHPTNEDAREAAEYLTIELFHDLPFVDEASRANALAATLTPLARTIIDGCIPMCLITKPTPGTGASLLVDIIALVARGKKVNSQKDPGSEDEWQKTLFSNLLKGNLMVCFDNIDSGLSSSTLSQVLTASNVEGRILGRSEVVHIPNKACWYATGNNLEIAGDLGRRSYLIQMDAKLPRPSERDPAKFRHKNITLWIRENRGSLIAAAFTMIKAWIIAGKPESLGKPMGSFEEWAKTIGSILDYAEVMGFRANDDILQKKIDVGAKEWEMFLQAWYERFGSTEVDAKEISGWVSSGVVTIPDEISKSTASGNASAISIGRALAKKVDREFSNGYVLRRQHNKTASLHLYNVETASSAQ